MPSPRDVLRLLNRRFYQEHGHAFGETRERPWRCWQESLPLVDEAARGGRLRLLEAGCGNGRYLRWLLSARPGLVITSVAVDLSLELLGRASRKIGSGFDRRWIGGNIEQWPLAPDVEHDLAVAWGVLHHLPDDEARGSALSVLARHLRPGGLLLLSTWAFDRPRFQAKRLGREEAKRRSGLPIPVAILEPEDAFFGFGTSPDAVRYCRLVGLPELERTVAGAGLEPLVVQEDRDEPNRWIAARRPWRDRLGSCQRSTRP